MFNYAYFLITPGVEKDSFITYSDEQTGNYFKFGDTNQNTENGIRQGYTTHNPDIGIGSVINNGLQNSNLGTRITSDLKTEGYSPVPGTTEWFSVNNEVAWRLFYVMQDYDKKTITEQTYTSFKNAVIKALEDESSANKSAAA